MKRAVIRLRPAVSSSISTIERSRASSPRFSPSTRKTGTLVAKARSVIEAPGVRAQLERANAGEVRAQLRLLLPRLLLAPAAARRLGLGLDGGAELVDANGHRPPPAKWPQGPVQPQGWSGVVRPCCWSAIARARSLAGSATHGGTVGSRVIGTVPEAPTRGCSATLPASAFERSAGGVNSGRSGTPRPNEVVRGSIAGSGGADCGGGCGAGVPSGFCSGWCGCSARIGMLLAGGDEGAGAAPANPPRVELTAAEVCALVAAATAACTPPAVDTEMPPWRLAPTSMLAETSSAAPTSSSGPPML